MVWYGKLTLGVNDNSESLLAPKGLNTGHSDLPGLTEDRGLLFVM